MNAPQRSPQFIHLRLHSEFSIADGLVRIDDVVEAAAADSQPALAITDLANLFGMVKFYKAARSKGIKPVIGCDVWITNDDDRDKPFRLLLLAKNADGYLQLCELISQAWLSNLHRGRAELRIEWLENLTIKQGLIALSGFHLGDIGCALENGNAALAERCARRWAAIFPGHFYIEVQRGGNPATESLLRELTQLAARLQLPVVATHPVQFLEQKNLLRTKPAPVSRKARCWPIRVASNVSRPSSILKIKAIWRRCLPTCRRRWLIAC